MSFVRSREFALALILAAMLLAAWRLDPRFVHPRAQMLLATHVWELAIVAVPMLLIVLSRGIDLSVGSTVALAGVCLGLAHERGAPPAVAILAALWVGAAAGALNGWCVARWGVHPLIATLATMAAYRGLAEGVTLARPISGYPEAIARWSQVPWPMTLFLLLAGAAAFVLARTVWGRWIVAVGYEERAARFAGIPVDRLKLALYTLSGTCCGLAAVLLVARNNTAKADMGMGLELEAITAVVLGGASIDGGKGKVSGLVLGLALIHFTREFVSWHWKRTELNLVVIGALLVAAVLLERALGSGKGSRRTS
ncbi:MAG: ABC transporter permease [Fimbriimonadaceae bacterium]|nr:ABC transporter permease [Fimbriimonadaceae bacterium]